VYQGARAAAVNTDVRYGSHDEADTCRREQPVTHWSFTFGLRRVRPNRNGAESKAVLQREIRERTVPRCVGRVDDDVVVSEVGEGKVALVEGVSEMRDLLPVKAHQPGAHEIDGDKRLSDHDDAGVDGIRRLGPVALTGDDSVDYRERASLWLVCQGPVGAGIEEDSIEVEDHPPDGVVAPPVAAADGRLGVAEQRDAGFAQHSQQVRQSGLRRTAGLSVLSSRPSSWRTALSSG